MSTPTYPQDPPERYIPLSQIAVDLQQIRHDLNDERIIELAATIQARGLLEPIGVNELGKDQYELLYGRRRLIAHYRLRRPTIRALVHQIGREETKTVALIENIQREQMTLSEECDAISHLNSVERLSPDQISTRIGRSRAWILRRLMVRGLPQDLQDPLLAGDLALGAAEELGLVEDEPTRRYITAHAVASKASITEIRALIQAAKDQQQIEPAIQAGIAAATSTVAPAVIMIQCARCQMPQALTKLTLVRICSDNCRETTATQTNPPNH